MCETRTKCLNLNKEYSDVLQVPDNGNVLEEFVIRDVAKNLVLATEVDLSRFERINTIMSIIGICSSRNTS
jgi:hypothetical protein